MFMITVAGLLANTDSGSIIIVSTCAYYVEIMPTFPQNS